jgi:hypothetical protein
MSYIPVIPVVNEVNNITNNYISECDLDKLEQLTIMNMKCCEFNSRLLIDINNKLVKYDEVFKKLLSCCERPVNTGVNIGSVIPGQIVNPPRTTIEVINNPKPIRREIREVVYESYEGGYITNGSVIDIPSNYKIVDGGYLDASGTDLRRYLPYEINIKNNNTILTRILDYRVVIGGGLYPRNEVILVYEVKDVMSGVIKTYEAGVNHFRSWWLIYTGVSKVTNQPIKNQRGVIG